MVDSQDGLFDEESRIDPPVREELTAEAVIEKLVESAKSLSQIASKIRADLDAIVDNAKEGRMSVVGSLVERASQAVQQLSTSMRTLDNQQRLFTVSDEAAIRSYCDELVAALDACGVTALEGPYPYWLVYPAWFKVELNAKGEIAVCLNGDVVDTVRPSSVAALIAQKAKEEFRAKDFAGLIRRVREIMRHSGSPVDSMMLEDVFQLMTLQPPRRGSRRSEFTQADFYYMVHRLADQEPEESSQGMCFPPANNPRQQFFTRDGEPRKYLAVVFEEAGRK